MKTVQQKQKPRDEFSGCPIVKTILPYVQYRNHGIGTGDVTATSPEQKEKFLRTSSMAHKHPPPRPGPSTTMDVDHSRNSYAIRSVTKGKTKKVRSF